MVFLGLFHGFYDDIILCFDEVPYYRNCGSWDNRRFHPMLKQRAITSEVRFFGSILWWADSALISSVAKRGVANSYTR